MMITRNRQMTMTVGEYDEARENFQADVKQFLEDMNAAASAPLLFAVDVNAKLTKKASGDDIGYCVECVTFDELLDKVYDGLSLLESPMRGTQTPIIRNTIVPYGNIAFITIRVGYRHQGEDVAKTRELPPHLYNKLFALAYEHDRLSDVTIITQEQANANKRRVSCAEFMDY